MDARINACGPAASACPRRAVPTRWPTLLTAILLLLLGATLRTAAHAETATLRIGHFPNITHIQALVAHGLSRSGQGWFEQRLGPDVKIEWFVYNAGPGAMEAIFADSIDITYVGPSPAINAYAKAHGDDIRIIAGAAEGGAALVVQPDENLHSPADFRGKKIATPQLGNTQDVSARAWLAAGGLHITLTGGDAQVIPTNNPDQLSLFKLKELDAVWTVEPWVSRLESEAGAKVLVEEGQAITTVIASGAKFLKAHRDLARQVVAAHLELTNWIRAHPEQAQKLAHDELLTETRTEIAPALIARAWARITLTASISREALEGFVARAKEAGFLRSIPDLSRLVEMP